MPSALGYCYDATSSPRFVSSPPNTAEKWRSDTELSHPTREHYTDKISELINTEQGVQQQPDSSAVKFKPNALLVYNYL